MSQVKPWKVGDVNLIDCDKEPIRVPGAIQPHGLLLVLETGSERIVRSAGNVKALIAWDQELVGSSFCDLAGMTLQSLAKTAGLEAGREPLFLGSFSPPMRAEIDILAHERRGLVLVELEPSLSNRRSAASLFAQLRGGVAKIKSARSVEAACEAAAESVRSLCEHDRVMIYQFLEDGTGKVVAETRAAHMGSFKNHRFPAGDIPQQARELYLHSLIRVIPDVGYTPAVLTGECEDDELDMSDCSLRSVSPIHIQYLRNMEVSSSMSVSIVIDGNLWGLIACHGAAPVLVPYELREACSHIASSLAQQIDTLLTRSRSKDVQRLAERREATLALLAESESLENELKLHVSDLALLFPCNGLIFRYGNIVATFGAVPDPELCKQLCAFILRQDQSLPFSTCALSSVFEPSAAYSTLVSGILALTIGTEWPLQIVWLRKEYEETIDWAGHPYKNRSANADLIEQLTPRASFATWREVLRGRSEPWSTAEIEAAERLRDGLERIRARQRIISIQAQVIHMSRVNAMGTMASTLAHELNQPLSVINNYTSGLSQMLRMRDDTDPEVLDLLESVSQQSLQAGEVIRNIRKLVAGGRTVLEVHSVRGLIESACLIGLRDAHQLGIQTDVEITGDLSVLADSVQIQQVLLNLIRNSIEAMKANGPRKRILTISADCGNDDFVEIKVADSGPGLSRDAHELLFSAFNSNKDDGLGIGLSICQTIVEAHGGKIQAGDSEVGGAVFTFTLQKAPE